LDSRQQHRARRWLQKWAEDDEEEEEASSSFLPPHIMHTFSAFTFLHFFSAREKRGEKERERMKQREERATFQT